MLVEKQSSIRNEMRKAINKENSYYQKVADDLSMGDRDEGMWTKAFSKSKGDRKETESIYIRLMVEKIIIEEQLKEAKEEEQKKEEKKLEEEREERERVERWKQEQERSAKAAEEKRQELARAAEERRQELARAAEERRQEVARIRKERKENKKPFLREDELFVAVITSTIIFLFEVNAIVKIPTPLFYIYFENIAIWDSFLFLYIFFVATISARIIRLFRTL